MDPSEYRSVIKFYVLLKKSNEILFSDLKTVYGENCPSKTTVYYWIAEFKRGRSSVLQDISNVGRPLEISESKVKQCEDLIREHRRIKVSELAEMVKVSVGSCHKIISSLSYRKLCSRFVPKFLTPEMKESRLQCAKANLELFSKHGQKFLENIVTEDETPLSLYLPESKRESSEWRKTDEKPPLKMRSGTSHRKSLMLSVFWDIKGIILLDFLPNGRTINSDYYSNMVAECKTKRRKTRNTPLWLLVDNAPVHSSELSISTTLESGFDLIPHPPYSPDLAPSDFHMFKHLKTALRGKHFESSFHLQRYVEEWFSELEPDFFRCGFDDLVTRWKKIVTVDGGYIEK